MEQVCALTQNLDTASEKQRIRQRRYRQRHPERIKDRWKSYYQKNKVAIASRQVTKSKKYYWKNRERILAKNRVWHFQNKEWKKLRDKEYRKANRERRRMLHRAWVRQKLSDPAFCERRRQKGLCDTNKRRALKVSAAINLCEIKTWVASVKKKHSFRCYYCKKRFPASVVHFDHIIALSRGGQHSVANLCTSCPPCNLGKGAKPIRLWVKTGQQILEL
jgi:5-methylcytosine-specific restriction endonuclease McrA